MGTTLLLVNLAVAVTAVTKINNLSNKVDKLNKRIDCIEVRTNHIQNDVLNILFSKEEVAKELKKHISSEFIGLSFREGLRFKILK